MNYIKLNHKARTIGFTALCAMAITACGGSDNDDPPAPTPIPLGEDLGLSSSVLNETHRFDTPALAISVSASASNTTGFTDLTIEAVNTTVAQPLSPLFIAVHEASASLFTEGMPASTAIEQMAEGGGIDELNDFANANPTVIVASGAFSGILPPLGTDSTVITVADADLEGAVISAVGMLVNTNDAFAGTNSYPLDGLASGGSIRLPTLVWDAGTEANTEAAGTMPGPADGGEGFNSVRDDLHDAVRIHPGVVTNAYSPRFATSDDS